MINDRVGMYSIPEVVASESTLSSFGTVPVGDVSTHGTESSGRSMQGEEVDRGGGSAVTAADDDDESAVRSTLS